MGAVLRFAAGLTRGRTPVTCGAQVAPQVTVGDMAETVSLTYKELASRLGITINSARIKVRRRKWRVLPGNHPNDTARVEVPTEWLSPVAHGGAGDGGATVVSPGDSGAVLPPVTVDDGGGLIPLSRAIAMVDAERAKSERQLSEQQARADAETARHLSERDTLHLGHVERLLAQAAVERSLWLERVDAAELRAERVEQRLDQVLDHLLQRQPEPAPRRGGWLGTSRRSDIGS